VSIEDSAPLRPDEVAIGMTYDQIDNFIEGKSAEILVTYQAQLLGATTRYALGIATHLDPACCMTIPLNTIAIETIPSGYWK